MEGIGPLKLHTNPKAPGPSLVRERNRRDATPRDADANLMTALLRKEPAAADALYARYASRIYGLGLVLLKNKADAEDLVQDTFLKVWRTGSAFDPQRGSLDTWILLTARSVAIDRLRRRALEARKLSSEPRRSDVSDEPGPEALWNESWYFDAVSDDASLGVYVRLGRLPNQDVSLYTVCVCGPGPPPPAETPNPGVLEVNPSPRA